MWKNKEKSDFVFNYTLIIFKAENSQAKINLEDIHMILGVSTVY